MNASAILPEPAETPQRSKPENAQPKRQGRRVLVIAACPFPASHGTPGSIRELVEATVEQGHEVHVATYSMGETTPVRGATLHRIRNWSGESSVVVGPTTRKPFYDLQLVLLAIQLIRKHKIEIVHAHGYEAAIAAAICRFVTRRPVIYSAHNQMGDELASYKFFRFDWVARSVAWVLDRTVPRSADFCIPHSDNLKRFLLEQGLRGRVATVVEFGIDLESFPQLDRRAALQDLGLSGDAPVVMYTGVLDAFQRIDLLLDAMQSVLRQVQDAKLVLVTSVPQEDHIRKIREQASRLGILHALRVTDPVDHTRACELLAACDVAVVSRPAAVAFPIKLLNYMAAERPTVMFRSSASGVVHGHNTWLVDEDTGAALGAGILDVLNDPALQARLSTNGRRLIEQRHCRTRSACRVGDIYERVIQPRIRQRTTSRRVPEAALLEATSVS